MPQPRRGGTRPPLTAVIEGVIFIGEQFDNAASLREIVRSGRKCKQGVSHKDGPTEFCYTALTSGGKLSDEIISGKYHARKGTTVQIYLPKKRTATAPWFRDRVWQRSMCDNGVYDDLTRGFLRANVACQKGKGQDMAYRIVIEYLQRLHRAAPGETVYGVHLDVQKYFPSTPQAEIKALDRSRVTEPRFIPYLDEVIDLQDDPRPEAEIRDDPFGKRGTGLGSQINQLNQIALLDGLDHEAAQICPCYIRYNDDFLILSHDRTAVEAARDLIKKRLTERGLTMTDKHGVFRAANGFYFLRKRFIMTETGKIIIRLHPRAMADERKTLRKLKAKVDIGARDMEDVKRHYQSWVANAEYAGDAPIREMDKFYTQLFRQKPEYKRKRRYLYGQDRRDRKRPH